METIRDKRPVNKLPQCKRLKCPMLDSNTIHVYSVTVMTHDKVLEAGQSSQGTSEPITPAHDTIHISCCCPAIEWAV